LVSSMVIINSPRTSNGIGPFEATLATILVFIFIAAYIVKGVVLALRRLVQ
jgi:hypothetical protein